MMPQNVSKKMNKVVEENLHKKFTKLKEQALKIESYDSNNLE